MFERFTLIAGPCVLEDDSLNLEIARALRAVSDRLGLPIVFKASFDKANRSKADSARGPGLTEGLERLARVKEETGLPVTTDIHEPTQAAKAARVVDVLQVPAFLCRQTDLVTSVARKGLIVNVKKGQFLAPWDIKEVIKKIESFNNHRILLTERGVSFGYNNPFSCVIY